MIPVDQMKLHNPDLGTVGDCARAAIASLLELPIDQVPDFTGGVPADTDEAVGAFWRRFDSFLESRGLMTYRIDGDFGSPSLHLASGYTERGASIGGVRHMVVRRGFDVVHDPHPSRAGIVSVRNVYLIVPLDIGRWTARA